MGNCYGNQNTDPSMAEYEEKDYNHKDFKEKQAVVKAGNQPQQESVQELTQAQIYFNQQDNDVESDNESVNIEQLDISKDMIWDKIVNSDQIDKSLLKRVKEQIGINNFQDKEFGPVLKSLTFDIKTFDRAKDYRWVRAAEFSQKTPKIFEGKIEPNDIKQGGLGDCYFLSSLSAMAEKPNLIARLFETKEYSDQGLYCIWLCDSGEWRQVVIDDYFPAYKTGKVEPAFSSGNGPELWVLLLEKAYAKINGCYANIEAGLTGNAIRDLTGAPYDFKNGQEEGPDAIWEFLQDKDNINNYICTAGSRADDRGTEIKQNTGIISGHAYAILDAQEVVNGEGQKERIIQLRNPWGSNEWTGAWSDKSSKWTDKLKKDLNWSDKDDGVFWMPIEEFCKSYQDITINYVHEDFHYSSFRIKTEFKKYFMIKFKVEKKNSLCYISLSQKNKRVYMNTDKDYDYSMASIILFKHKKKSDSPLPIVEKFVNDEYSNQRDIWKKHHYPKGEYTALISVDWCQKEHSDVVVSAYSEYPVKFKEDSLKFISQEDFETIVDQCAIKKKPQEKFTTHYKQADNVFKVKGKLGGYVYYAYHNNSSNWLLQETCQLKNRNGVDICAPYMDSDKFEVQVKPKDKQVVKYRIDPSTQGAYGYGAGYATAFKHTGVGC